MHQPMNPIAGSVIIEQQYEDEEERKTQMAGSRQENRQSYQKDYGKELSSNQSEMLAQSRKSGRTVVEYKGLSTVMQ